MLVLYLLVGFSQKKKLQLHFVMQSK